MKVINFSGGRSSGYMLYSVLKENDFNLPENIKVVFANTGMEHRYTYDFIRDCAEKWKVKIWCVEYRNEAFPFRKYDEKIGKKYAIVPLEKMSSGALGEEFTPFGAMLEKGNYLPSPFRRVCTATLKVSAIDNFVRFTFGKKQAKNVDRCVGIRYDEKRRWSKMKGREGVIFPLVETKTTRKEVMEFWQNNSFDLKLLAVVKEQTLYGNCVGCFLKGSKKLSQIFKQNPKYADFWIEAEKNAAERDFIINKSNNYFNSSFSYKGLAERQKERIDFFDSEINDCFCGD